MSSDYLFDNGNIKVGNGILKVDGVTYPIRAINSIRSTLVDKRDGRIGAVILYIIAFFVLFAGPIGVIFCVVCAFFAYGIWKNAKKYHRLFINTAGGEIQVIHSDNESDVAAVRRHIEACIAEEAQPFTSLLGVPSRMLDVTPPRVFGSRVRRA